MQKPVEPKKILCIHDLSVVGRCSLAVILPVLSVMGFQPVALPTVVLSTHTGGLGTPARLDGRDNTLVTERAIAAAVPEEFVTALVSKTLGELQIL